MVIPRPPRQVSRRPPARARRRRAIPIRRARLGPFGSRRRWLLLGCGAVAAIFCWAALVRHFAPASNTDLSRFDAIVVLGNPADSDGNPTPTELARVTEGVQEYERNVAPRLIFTGGAAHNRFVEADVMSRVAEAQGIPPSAVFLETHSRDTMQNACNVLHLMRAHGWDSAEVVTSPAHVPRAGLIFNQLPLKWRTDAAPPLEPASTLGNFASAALETLKTVHYLLYSRWAERCQP